MNNHRFHPDSGFTLIEVVAGIVVVTFFTAATMQMLVTSAHIKAKAREYAAAANLIQEDLEALRSEAGKFEFPEVSASVSPPNPAGSSQIQLNSLTGISSSSRLQFVGNSNVYTSYTLDTTNNRLTISSPGVLSTVNNGTVLVNNTLCNATTVATGLATQLDTTIALPASNPGFPTFADRGNLPADYLDYKSVSPNAFPLLNNQGNITGKRLWVMRKETPVNSRPYDTLNVRYLVVQNKNNRPDKVVVNQLSSEVIPNAAYQCIK